MFVTNTTQFIVLLQILITRLQHTLILSDAHLNGRLLLHRHSSHQIVRVVLNLLLHLLQRDVERAVRERRSGCIHETLHYNHFEARILQIIGLHLLHQLLLNQIVALALINLIIIITSHPHISRHLLLIHRIHVLRRHPRAIIGRKRLYLTTLSHTHLRQQAVEPTLHKTHLLLRVRDEERRAEAVPLLSQTHLHLPVRVHAQLRRRQSIVQLKRSREVVNGRRDASAGDSEVGNEEEKETDRHERTRG